MAAITVSSTPEEVLAATSDELRAGKMRFYAFSSAAEAKVLVYILSRMIDDPSSYSADGVSAQREMQDIRRKLEAAEDMVQAAEGARGVRMSVAQFDPIGGRL